MGMVWQQDKNNFQLWLLNCLSSWYASALGWFMFSLMRASLPADGVNIRWERPYDSPGMFESTRFMFIL